MSTTTVDVSGFEEWDGDVPDLIGTTVVHAPTSVATSVKRSEWERTFTTHAGKRLITELFNLTVPWTAPDNTPFKIHCTLSTKKIKNIVIELVFNNSTDVYYPYYPPTLTIINPYFWNIAGKLSNLRMLQLKYWNPIRTIDHILTTLQHILDKHASVQTMFTIDDAIDSVTVKQLNACLAALNNLSETVSIVDDLDVNVYPIINRKQMSQSADASSASAQSPTVMNLSALRYIASQSHENTTSHTNGIGYGTNASSVWDISKWEAAKHVKMQKMHACINDLSALISTCYTHSATISHQMVYYNCTMDTLTNLFLETDIMEMFSTVDKWHSIVAIMICILEHASTDTHIASLNLTLNKNTNTTGQLYKKILAVIDMMAIMKHTVLIKSLKSLFILIEQSIPTDQLDKLRSNQTGDRYVDLMADEQWLHHSIVATKASFYLSKNATPVTKFVHTKRIIAEICNLSVNLPLNRNASIIGRFDESNIGYFKFAIIGPPDTPYGGGIFLFDVALPQTYPYPQTGESPIRIILTTTGNGTVRFNPNLYSDGKVCLSLLGTFNGHPSEKWRPEGSTILQLLVSLQATVMNAMPYYNEPGYYECNASQHYQQQAKEYNTRIRLATMKWAINDNLQRPHPAFANVITTHFRERRDEIIAQCEAWTSEAPDTVKAQFQKELDIFKALI